MLTNYIQPLSAFVQEHITKNYPEALSLTDRAFMVKAYISKCLKDNEDKTKELLSEGYSEEELTDIIYSDMAEYSVLTEYLMRGDIEEININGWDDIARTRAMLQEALQAFFTAMRPKLTGRCFQ